MRESESTLAWQARVKALEAETARLRDENRALRGENGLAEELSYRLNMTTGARGRILAVLYGTTGMVTNDTLLDLCGGAWTDPKILVQHVCHIRKALGGLNTVENIRSLGYVLTPEGRRCVEAALADMHKSGERAV